MAVPVAPEHGNTCTAQNTPHGARQTAGMRKYISGIEIYIDIKRWYEDGRVAYRSESDVILFARRIELKYVK